MDIEFRNLTYTIRNRASKRVSNTRNILKGVHGKFTSGKLAAIMGPSGAGKSSLLNAISGYISAGVSGDILVNDRARDARQFHRASCYITQEDLLQPLLSVREAMDLASRLKLPNGMTIQSEDILKNLGLLEHQHTRTDNLSGGQKKRLSIALELVNNPPIFFLDEPTSGLDTVATTQCVRLLRQLARQGRTVVATIHQPSAALLDLFDHVYIIAQGECIFYGDTGAIVPFLKTLELACPKHHNPSDYIMEITETAQVIKMLSKAVGNGQFFQAANVQETKDMELTLCYHTDETLPEKQIVLSDNTRTVEGVQFHQRRVSSSSASSQLTDQSASMTWLKVTRSGSTSCGYATSGFTQFRLLLARMFLQISRNRQALWIQLIHHIMCGVLIGTCFYGTANDGKQMFNHLKYCIGVAIFFGYTQIMVPVLVFPEEVKLVKKEYFNRWYGITPYYAALTVSKLPIQILLNILFCLIVYFMAGLPSEFTRFAIFCLVGNVVSFAAEGLGLAIGSVFNITNGCAIGPAAMAPFLGLAIYGFDFAHEIPWLMNVIMKMSFLRCGVVAIVLTVFGSGRPPLECEEVYCHFAKPSVLLHYLDVEADSVWYELLFLTGLMLLFRSMCYLGLRWRFAT